jgi:hypothetical protein
MSYVFLFRGTYKYSSNTFGHYLGGVTVKLMGIIILHEGSRLREIILPEYHSPCYASLVAVVMGFKKPSVGSIHT